MDTSKINVKDLTTAELSSYNGGEILTALAIGIVVGGVAALLANRRDKRKAQA